MPRKMTHEEFVEKLKNQHPNLELLSEYNGNNGKITVRCKIHDYTFITTPHRLNTSDCQKCYDDRRGNTTRKSTAQFIENAKKIHGDKYDYSKVIYKNNKTHVIIICPIHGEFLQRPDKHLRGQGCDKCADELNGFNKRLSQEEFIRRAKEIHNNKYDYSKVVYKGYEKDITIICPYHGEFIQKAYYHLVGYGCSRCNTSHLERRVKCLLEGEEIKEWYKFKELGRQNLDIYLPQYKIAIECQGGQHIMPIHHFGGEKEFEKVIERDIRKNQICKENGINLLYVFPREMKTKLKQYMEQTENCIYTDNNTFILEEIENKEVLLNNK